MKYTWVSGLTMALISVGCAEQPSSLADRSLANDELLPRQAVVDLLTNPNLTGTRRPIDRSGETLVPAQPSSGISPAGGACGATDAICTCEYFVDVANACGPVLYEETSRPFDDNIEIHFSKSACAREDVQSLIWRYCDGADCGFWIPILDCMLDRCDLDACIRRDLVDDEDAF